MHNKLDMSELPNFYLQTASQIKNESSGVHKLRLRNNQIFAELSDYAARHNTKVSIHKSGDRTWLCVENLGVTVSIMS